MNWRFSIFLVALASLLVGITWTTSNDGMCSSAYIRGVLADHTKDGALNCFDFWLNRYQTLVGTLIALAAALLAFFPARGQLQEARRQSAISASQSAAGLAKDLEKEIQIYIDAKVINSHIERLLEDIEYNGQQGPVKDYLSQISTAETKLMTLRATTASFQDRFPPSDNQNKLRKEFIKRITDLESGLRFLRTSLQNGDDDCGEDGRSFRSPEELVRDDRYSVEDSNAEFEEARIETLASVRERIRSSWIEVRVFEAEAMDGR